MSYDLIVVHHLMQDNIAKSFANHTKVTIYELFGNRCRILVTIWHNNGIILSSYRIADDDDNPIEQINPSDNGNPRGDEGKKCPFCREDFISQQLFDDHVLTVHSIDQEGLKQLKSMMKAQQLVSRNQLTYIAEKEGDFPDAPRATKGT